MAFGPLSCVSVTRRNSDNLEHRKVIWWGVLALGLMDSGYWGLGALLRVTSKS